MLHTMIQRVFPHCFASLANINISITASIAFERERYDRDVSVTLFVHLIGLWLLEGIFAQSPCGVITSNQRRESNGSHHITDMHVLVYEAWTVAIMIIIMVISYVAIAKYKPILNVCVLSLCSNKIEIYSI